MQNEKIKAINIFVSTSKEEFKSSINKAVAKNVKTESSIKNGISGEAYDR